MRLIYADELKEKIENIELSLTNKKNIINMIDNAPTVTPDKIQAIMSDYLIYRTEPERPKGKWVIIHHNDHKPDIICTNCGYDDGYSCFKYCPNCGADMRGDNNG